MEDQSCIIVVIAWLYNKNMPPKVYNLSSSKNRGFGYSIQMREAYGRSETVMNMGARITSAYRLLNQSKYFRISELQYPLKLGGNKQIFEVWFPRQKALKEIRIFECGTKLKKTLWIIVVLAFWLMQLCQRTNQEYNVKHLPKNS